MSNEIEELNKRITELEQSIKESEEHVRALEIKLQTLTWNLTKFLEKDLEMSKLIQQLVKDK